MSVGTGVAVICADSVTEGSGALMDSLSRTHEVVAITWPQVQAFAGNILEVVDARGLPAMVMSTQAYRAFTDEQKRVIERHCPGGLHHAPVDTLERIGGGGVRCCIAELF
uniref:Uncharacterized protein n=1 Tax=Chloropicon laureae TaxID=464258 RepID=A0A7S2Z629_9CHLO|mmetsp:Transcript_6907/g.17854  ORF Transcript_6907/g.17854 Transcript_6907/m.17854 type:complete len:110 (+) Transcript_6907:107-436(+)|eukprot:CAMPEP_0197488066 /NCGR_PEP_ID=MMETSP1311-20131121/3081_1 /TAXON_ID=464262 /ORGANISM="Genus nov. species nov., Strain RCC856" /LENGTH=109 /DNA_ID=CAMNT_0043031987 /DNA_START=199 /DNA_END=528 /DNA_ORIENTATION=+